MYQSMVEGRVVPWSLLVKDVPPAKHQDLDYLVEQLDWEKNVDPNFKKNNFLEPIPDGDTASAGYVDKWIVYGKVNGKELFSAKELTINPGVRVTISYNGCYGLVAVQGSGLIGNLPLQTPAMIRFGELTEDEVFVTADCESWRNVLQQRQRTAGDPAVYGPDVNPGMRRSRNR